MTSNSRRVSSRPRLLVGSSITSTRAPVASARAISTICCAATARRACARIERDVGPADARRAPARRCLEPPPSGRLRDARVRRRGRCSPSPRDGARARAPGRSSRRRRAARRAGCLGWKGAPSSSSVAGVRAQRTGEDRHQRALAGAVLADERADLAGAHGEIDAVHRDAWRRMPFGCPASRSGGRRLLQPFRRGLARAAP